MLTPSRSLRTRLLYSLAIVLVVFLGLMGWVIDRAFKNSTEQSVQERMLLHTYGLLAVSEEIDGDMILPEALFEPKFNTLGTGLFAFVYGDRSVEAWRSPSALELDFPPGVVDLMLKELEPGQQAFGKTTVAENEKFYLAYKVLWQTSPDDSRTYSYLILEDSGPFRATIAEFRNGLWGGMLGVVLVLLLFQGAVMSWNLRPLRQLAEELHAMEDGRQNLLEGDYPRELSQLTNNLNTLIRSERDQRERYRTTMADLAHSLKTPLAILQGEASVLQLQADSESERESVATISGEVDRMNDIIGYQLERAVSRGSEVATSEVDIKSVVTRLTQALGKVYLEKDLTIVNHADGAKFSADERDIMELLGNLLDNACKYGHSTVEVTASSAGGTLELVVEDDGDGIPAGMEQRVQARGERMDTREAGQGIGLAVVREIVDRYSGAVEFGSSALGGAAIRVTLKSVPA